MPKAYIKICIRGHKSVILKKQEHIFTSVKYGSHSVVSLCDPLDCSPPASSGERRKDTEMTNPSLLQWIFLT